MATLLKLSETRWLHTDTVTLIRQEGEQGRVWVYGQAEPLRLTPEEEQTLAYYVLHEAPKIFSNHTP